MTINEILAKEFNVPLDKVDATVGLIDAGNTIPFIARYRKEVTGSLDDTVLRGLSERLSYLRSLDKRRSEIRALIDSQGKLTPEVEKALDSATVLNELEDIYRPFKPHRKTRASVARERGLEDLATLLIMQEEKYEKPLDELAAAFIDEEKGVPTLADAYAGACDIIAEDVSDNAEYRKRIRALTHDYGELVSVAAKNEDSVYAMYYDYRESVAKVPGHRVLAMNRGEREGFLRVSIDMPRDIILNWLFAQVIETRPSEAKKYVMAAVVDSYDRLIAPSVEREISAAAFDEASEGAIKLFSENLRHLLMAAPLKGKVVLGYDPGYRTGCKLAVVDKIGRVLDTAVIYPTKPQERIEESKRIVKNLVRKYDIDVIAIGNGTASKESEIFIAGVLRELERPTKYVMVSEAGASVYSASELGADEFPDFDVTQRSAVSIARRLQDPLAELVKIDPKSIGVGQYQHDMKPARLDEALGGVVEDCVNAVGVDVNTASYSLLEHVAGINAASAKNIVKYREENGEFTSRAQLLKVPRVGARAFEQCAGFLRVSGGGEILDNTGVHPESYGAAKALLRRFGYTDDDVRSGRVRELRVKLTKAGIKTVADELGIGEPTLEDIVGELEKPGRDVRDSMPQPVLRDDVMDISDLREGMVFDGVVRNVIDFGAFVDIGVHEDGLVHISEMADHYVRRPGDVVAVGDVVRVRVKSVDTARKRIALSMRF